MASRACDSGDQDRAIILLVRASVEDPEYYLPFSLLGGIYSVRGNTELALEMYKRALQVFPREKVLHSKTLEQKELVIIRNNIDVLQKQLRHKHPESK